MQTVRRHALCNGSVEWNTPPVAGAMPQFSMSEKTGEAGTACKWLRANGAREVRVPQRECRGRRHSASLAQPSPNQADSDASMAKPHGGGGCLLTDQLADVACNLQGAGMKYQHAASERGHSEGALLSANGTRHLSLPHSATGCSASSGLCRQRPLWAPFSSEPTLAIGAFSSLPAGACLDFLREAAGGGSRDRHGDRGSGLAVSVFHCVYLALHGYRHDLEPQQAA